MPDITDLQGGPEVCFLLKYLILWS